MPSIYKITNTVNSKIYIGKTIRIKDRWSKHLYFLRKGNHVNKHLSAAFKMYGEEAFRFDIIEVCSPENLSEREIYWIGFYQSYRPANGYNKTMGGEGNSGTEETRLKISNSLRGIKHTPERNLNRSLALKGKLFSEERKVSLSKSRKRQHQTNPDRVNKMRAVNSKPVYQYDKNMNLVKHFLSVREAERKTNIHSSSIARCCNNSVKTAGGFIWKYEAYNAALKEAIKLIP
jgi:group I intron endonuclease